MTAHAKQQSLVRGVDEGDVERIINDPIETIENKYEETYKSYGKGTEPFARDLSYLVIIHTSLNNRYVKIITVMWSNDKGLKHHGFSNI